MTSLDAVLARLYALHPKKIDLSLDRMHRILAALGDPHRRLPPVIHVAGTNGKGSTVAFLRAMAEAAGLRTHVYTSPHLVHFTERFRLAAPGGGRFVEPRLLADVLARIERANDGAPITVFEITTAAGLVMFAEQPADLLLLETGLGGRLDATNVIDAPLATVITPVSMDHAEFLGDTVSAIAGEKAGILKPACPAVLARQTSDALSVIERRAQRLKAPLHVSGEHWHSGEENGRLVFQDEHGLLDLPSPRLQGRHQFENAGAAIATLRVVADRLAVPVEAIAAGLAAVDWPGRLQRIAAGRLRALLPGEAELWIDGGHNADGGRVLAEALAAFEERVPRPLVLVVGMLATKDPVAFLDHFAGLAARLVAVPIPGQEKALAPHEIAVVAAARGVPATEATSIDDALRQVAALDLLAPPRVVVTGSLYLAGHVLGENGTVIA